MLATSVSPQPSVTPNEEPVTTRAALGDPLPASISPTVGAQRRVKPSEQLLGEIRSALSELESGEQQYSNFLQFFKARQVQQQR